MFEKCDEGFKTFCKECGNSCDAVYYFGGDSVGVCFSCIENAYNQWGNKFMEKEQQDSGGVITRDTEQKVEDIQLRWFKRMPDGSRKETFINLGLPLGCGDFAMAGALKGFIVFFRSKLALGELTKNQDDEFFDAAEEHLEAFQLVLKKAEEENAKPAQEVTEAPAPEPVKSTRPSDPPGPVLDRKG